MLSLHSARCKPAAARRVDPVSCLDHVGPSTPAARRGGGRNPPHAIGGRPEPAVRRFTLAAHRSVSRRTSVGGSRRTRRAAALLLRERERRRLGDAGCRADVAADLRRPTGRVDWRNRAGAVQSARHLRRHGRGRHALGHRAGRRPVSIDRRRPDVEHGRSCRFTADRADRRSPLQPRSRVRRGARSSVRTERRARCLPIARTVAAHGRRCLARTRTRAPSTSCSNRAIHRCCTRLCGRRDGHRGTSIHRRMGPAAVSTPPRTAATTGPRSRQDCPTTRGG